MAHIATMRARQRTAPSMAPPLGTPEHTRYAAAVEKTARRLERSTMPTLHRVRHALRMCHRDHPKEQS